MFLQISLPRIHHSILIPSDLLEGQHEQDKQDILYSNLSVKHITRVKTNYRGLCKLLLLNLIKLELKPTQLRLLVDICCRYYLLFWDDPKQTASQLFATVFDKCSEAVRFSLTD